MFRKMQEVLFRKERMCATRFSTSLVAHLRMTERNTTKHGYAIWTRKQDANCDDGWKNDAGFVSRPDIFVWKVSTRCMIKKYGTPIIIVSPDGSLRRSADGLVDIHTNPPLSLEIMCLFSFTQGVPMYSLVPIRHIPQCTLYGADELQSEGHLLLCWSPKKWLQ